MPKPFTFVYHNFCARWTGRWLICLYFKWHFKNWAKQAIQRNLENKQTNCFVDINDNQQAENWTVWDSHRVMFKSYECWPEVEWEKVGFKERKLPVVYHTTNETATKLRQQKITTSIRQKNKTASSGWSWNPGQVSQLKLDQTRTWKKTVEKIIRV